MFDTTGGTGIGFHSSSGLEGETTENPSQLQMMDMMPKGDGQQITTYQTHQQPTYAKQSAEKGIMDAKHSADQRNMPLKTSNYARTKSGGLGGYALQNANML